MSQATPVDKQAEPLCPHFGECGGCAHQDLAYEAQLVQKAAQLGAWFGAHWREPVSVAPSPAVWHYRNRVDLAFAPQWYEEPPPPDFVRETVLGFKRKGRWFQPLPIEECLIGPEGLDDLLPAVRQWVAAEGLRAFDSRTHRGWLKLLLVRQGKRTGQRLVALLTGQGEHALDAFHEAVQSSFPATSLHHGVSESAAGAAFAEETTLLDGAPTIDETLEVPTESGPRRLTFRISPFSFFQTNTLATEVLYAKVREAVAEAAPAVLYDLYGGAGGIALTCADLVDGVESVESVESATLDGRHNAQVNGVDNVRFHTAKVKDYLRVQRDHHGGLAGDCAVVLDPPRAGLHPKVLKRLGELCPPRIVHVSCNPRIFARDELPLLLENYRLSRLEAVDLFPHTPHVEAIAVLDRRM